MSDRAPSGTSKTTPSIGELIGTRWRTVKFSRRSNRARYLTSLSHNLTASLRFALGSYLLNGLMSWQEFRRVCGPIAHLLTDIVSSSSSSLSSLLFVVSGLHHKEWWAPLKASSFQNGWSEPCWLVQSLWACRTWGCLGLSWSIYSEHVQSPAIFRWRWLLSLAWFSYSHFLTTVPRSVFLLSAKLQIS